MDLIKTKDELVSKVMKKKELSGLDKALVKDIVEEKLKKLKLKIPETKKSEQKELVKEIRAELRKYAGRFQKSLKKRKQFLQEGKITQLLKSHSSTAERLEFYPKIRELIKNLNISSIIDIGCGINPIAIANKDITYYASDINRGELSLVNEYFKSKKIKGETFVFDLRKIKTKKLPIQKADLCIIFKVLDIVGKGMHNLAESIIDSLDCKYYLISFSTKTLSGKPMNRPKRLWMEDLLKNRGLKFNVFETKNEIFYLAYPKNNLAPVDIK